VLCLASPPFESIGYAAVLAAPLVKIEGLYFSLPILAVVAGRRVKPWLYLAPGAIYLTWVQLTRSIQSSPDRILFSTPPRAALDRLRALISVFASRLFEPDYPRSNGLVSCGLAALAVLPFIYLFRKKEPAAPLAKPVLLAAIALVILPTVGLSYGERDVVWYANVTYGRLLLHAAALFLLAPMLVQESRRG
jgi:hypothetical protein